MYNDSAFVCSQANVLIINNIHELQTSIFMYTYLHNMLFESYMHVYNNDIH